MKEPLVSLKKVSAGYQNNIVLRDVSLDIFPDDFIGVIGPNGGGKTTLMKLILGLLNPLKGKVNNFISRDRIGYLPQINQFDDQFPITVREVVRSGLSKGLFSRNEDRSSASRKVAEVLDKAGITGLQDRPIGELSGGELQRTMLARAIVSTPLLLVLDEPNTYVDNRFEQELYRLLKELNKQMAILLVSHDVGTLSPYIRSIACVNRTLHYHPSNEITQEQLKVYNCPIEIITHGPVPHRVMSEHLKEENGSL